MPEPETFWETQVSDAFGVIAGQDLRAGRTTAETVSGPNRDQALSGVARVWGKSNVAEAIAWAKGLPDGTDRNEVIRKIRTGAEQLAAAGFSVPETFVAPHDKISRAAYPELKKQFRVISTGWFEANRIPRAWLPRYCCRKLLRRPHWRVGRTLLLSHPGCILSRNRPYEGMLDQIKRAVTRGRLTVLVTHWWEYFPNQKPDADFIGVLHTAAHYLAANPAIRVISFADLPARKIPLN